MSDDAVWKSIDVIRDQCALHAQAIAVIKHEQETQRRMMNEQHSAIITQLSCMNAKIDTMASDIHEARGGLRVGRWLGATFVTLAALGVSILAYFRGS